MGEILADTGRVNLGTRSTVAPLYCWHCPIVTTDRYTHTMKTVRDRYDHLLGIEDAELRTALFSHDFKIGAISERQVHDIACRYQDRLSVREPDRWMPVERVTLDVPAGLFGRKTERRTVERHQGTLLRVTGSAYDGWRNLVTLRDGELYGFGDLSLPASVWAATEFLAGRLDPWRTSPNLIAVQASDQHQLESAGALVVDMVEARRFDEELMKR